MKQTVFFNGTNCFLLMKQTVLHRGIFGESSDMRDLENAVAAGNPKAVLAEEMYFYRIKKYIGAYRNFSNDNNITLFHLSLQFS